jgi:predicted unusual protein kinase regulating ubiquinone biosynthesis (AarF/ABC1/UbiB family)
MRYPDEAGSLSAVLNAVFDVLADNGLRLGSELTMALKTLIQAEAIVHTLDYWLDITRESFVFIQGFLTEQFNVETVKATVQTQVAALYQRDRASPAGLAAGDDAVAQSVRKG